MDLIPHFAGVILGPGPGRPGALHSAREHPASIFARLFTAQPFPQLSGHYVPIFGLCLGHQALGYAYGGSVGPSPRVLHGQTCNLEIELDALGFGKSVLNRVPQAASVVRYNSLTINPESLSPATDVEVTAWAQDGLSRTVMGLQHRKLPFHSVQFHPESVCSQGGVKIIESFLDLISQSEHVKNGLGVHTAYSSLPRHILEYSELKMGLQSPLHTCPPSSLGGSAFQLRTKVFCQSPHHPEQVFGSTVQNSGCLGEIWLDSADYAPGVSSYQGSHSCLASIDVLFSYFAAEKSLLVTNKDLTQGQQDLAQTSFWEWLRLAQQVLGDLTSVSKPVFENQSGLGNSRGIGANSASSEDPLQAPVGFFGYIGYELLSETSIGCGLPSRSLKKIPDAELGFCNSTFYYDHRAHLWAASALVRVDEKLAQKVDVQLGASIGLSEEQFQTWISKAHLALLPNLKSTSCDGPLSRNHTSDPVRRSPSLRPIRCKSVASENTYLKAIATAQSQIYAGESYELCLTTQFQGRIEGNKQDHFAHYLNLRKKNPAPYAAYMHFSPSQTHILSSSPERFMKVGLDGRVEMKPIKGTSRRQLDDPVSDAQIGRALQENPKERAENLMITDLIRHELHAFCIPGSVTVTKLFSVESMALVHSLVSTVVGQLRPGLNAVDALQESFPPGSMTGAPKLSSIEILDRLEEGRPRGIYSGILGYLSVDGRSDMSVVIRTAVIRGSEFRIGGGGAITTLSQPEEEWREVQLKVESVLGKHFNHREPLSESPATD